MGSAISLQVLSQLLQQERRGQGELHVICMCTRMIHLTGLDGLHTGLLNPILSRWLWTPLRLETDSGAHHRAKLLISRAGVGHGHLIFTTFNLMTVILPVSYCND
jgi:hypothetical protein